MRCSSNQGIRTEEKTMCGPSRRRKSRHHFHIPHGHLHLPLIAGRTATQEHETHGSGETSSLGGPLPTICLVCGTPNPEDARYCAECGHAMYVCPISQKKFRQNDEFVQCPECLTVFHAHHFDQWMSNSGKNKCPYCGRTLSQVFRGKAGIHQVKTI